MKRFRLFATAAAIAAVSVTPVAAQGKSGAAPKGGKQPTTSAAPTNHGQSQKVAGNTSSSTTTSPGSNGAARSAAAKASNPGAGKKPVTTRQGRHDDHVWCGKHDLRQHDRHDLREHDYRHDDHHRNHYDRSGDAERLVDEDLEESSQAARIQGCCLKG